MSEMKHTPGPWNFGPEYRESDSTFNLFGPDGEKVVSCLDYENMWLSACDEKTDAANARLIAAAPELLEALKLARRYVADLPIVGDADLAVIDAALSKATGAPQ